MLADQRPTITTLEWAWGQDSATKQIGFEFRSNCRDVLGQLFRQMGVNINDVILDLLRDLTAPESAE